MGSIKSKKLCPVMGCVKACLDYKCAWFDGVTKECALLAIVKSIRRIWGEYEKILS